MANWRSSFVRSSSRQHSLLRSAVSEGHEATVFPDDMATLGPQLGADVSKTSAREINRSLSVAQGIGLGF